MARKKKSPPQSLATYGDADYNPRDISQASLMALRESLQIFGDLSGFVVNKRTGNVVCGHQRRRALGENIRSGITYGKPVKVERGTAEARFVSAERHGQVKLSTGETFSVREVDWPEDFEKAANVTANSPTLQGIFTDDLAEVIADVRDTMPDIVDTLMLDDLIDDAGAPDVVIETLPPEPPMSMVWVMVGIPAARYPEHAAAMEQLEGAPDVIFASQAR